MKSQIQSRKQRQQEESRNIKKAVDHLRKLPIIGTFDPEWWIKRYMRVAPPGREISKRNWAVKRLVEKLKISQPFLRYMIPEVMDMKVCSNEPTPKPKVKKPVLDAALDDQQLVQREIIKSMRLANSNRK